MKEAKTGKEEMKIAKIKNGTVIDHIPPGRSLEVLKILGILPGTKAKISLIMNAQSSKMKNSDFKKDIIKIEDRELSTLETDKIAIISPEATINIIRDYKVTQKHQVKFPEKIISIISCPRLSCITNDPREAKTIKSVFEITDESPIIIKCCYCEEQIEEKDIFKYIKY